MRIVITLTVALCLSVVASALDFNRDVRPILAKKCLTCHGPDEAAREAGLRLDTQNGSREDLGGYAAIEPGDADASELFTRITSEDPDLRMPPSDSHPPLSDQDIDVLRRWIAAGGDYEQHWAFVKPKATRPPVIRAQSPLDAFVQNQQKGVTLSPGKQADKATWLRRAYLDMTSTLPTRDETDRFIADDHPLARRRIVDRLLASPDFGEKFTRHWLDLARYADTNGYEKDRPRTIWPYRDWVLDAINSDMPFDQFSIEQLAGDMLPEATDRQRIATGFHRNTMLNEEGGIDPLEYRWLSIVDRVATTGTVWLGLTTGCAQCHTHKYDPITHTDYYQWFALLNQADEPELAVNQDSIGESNGSGPCPSANVSNEYAREHQAYETLAAEHLTPGSQHHAQFEQFLREERTAFRDWRRLPPTSWESTTPILSRLEDDSILAGGDVSKRDIYTIRFPLPETGDPIHALQLEALPHESLPSAGPGMAYYEGRRGDFFLSEIAVQVDGQAIQLVDASHSFGKLSVGSGSADAANVLDGDGSTGWSTSTAAGQANRLVLNFAEPIRGATELQVELLFERHFAAALGHFAVAVTTSDQTAVASRLPPELARRITLTNQPDAIADARTFFARTSPTFAKLRKPIEDLVATRRAPRTLVMKQRSTDQLRATYRHNRGEYLQPKEAVDADNLSLFGPLSPKYPNDRLGLARFLVSEDNPLVGRVQMNRLWRHFFGTGIVNTAGDFGTQSESPSHPKLLDWLAVDWMSNGWSIKRSIREIVLSSTYSQAVSTPPASDPSNRLLSVFPYRRMDAESIRDSMLSASRLLAREWGGPSVHPPQPESVSQLAYGKPDWTTSDGTKRYRRSVYTFARRTAPFAAFTTFDGPTGEQCIARRDTSTNPLQALTLLNDNMFMEYAEALAEDVLRNHNDAEPREIAEAMFRSVLVREPTVEEQDSIEQFFESTGDWTLVARAILNTDEAITIP